jgi:hypothetical protein
MWKGRPISDPSHADHLEVLSALNTFHRNMPVHEAEEAAHEDYKKDQLAESGAFHLQGMKAALASDDHESAKKHGILYAMAMKHLGHSAVGEPPKEVIEKTKSMENAPYKFKAHKADHFYLKEDKKED